MPHCPRADGAAAPGISPGHHRHSCLGGPVRQPVKSFLAQNAGKLPQVSCVVTRGGADRCDDVLAHMATFLKRMRLTDVSLRPDDAGYEFWRDKFIQDTKNALGL